MGILDRVMFWRQREAIRQSEEEVSRQLQQSKVVGERAVISMKREDKRINRAVMVANEAARVARRIRDEANGS